MGILDFLEVLAFKKLSVPQQPTGRAGTELQCSLEMENTLGMVAGLHVQQHIQDTKHRVTVLPSTNAPLTKTHLPLGILRSTSEPLKMKGSQNVHRGTAPSSSTQHPAQTIASVAAQYVSGL